MKVFLIIGFLIFFIIIIYNILFSVKLRLQTLNFYSGGLGSGKTLIATQTAIKLRRKSLLAYYLFSWNLGRFPKLKNKFAIRQIYSNYPILIKNKKKKKEFSHILERDHVMGLKKLPERCIIVLDEASVLFPNSPKKSDPQITYSIRWLRHFTNGTVIMCDQSIGDIDIAIRRRVNKIYNFVDFRKILLIAFKVQVLNINYMEDVVYNVHDVDTSNKKFYFSFFGPRKYDSRYMRLFYNPLTDAITNWNDLLIVPPTNE